ncbi:hypothetical protein CISIN_1g0070501mg, partial [Citrus sinensis]
MQQDHRKK